MANCVSYDKVSQQPCQLASANVSQVQVPFCNEDKSPRPDKIQIANDKCLGEGPLVQTGQITAPRLSSPFNALADRVDRSGSHPPSIEAPVGQNRGRLQNPAKARLVIIVIRLCRGEAALRK